MNNEALYNSDPASFRVVEMLENIPDNFLSVDQHWQITYVNKAFEKLYRVNRWDITGKSIWDLFPGSLQQGFDYYKNFTHCLEKQEAIEFESYAPFAKIWLYLKVYPITDGLAIYSRDITSQKQLRDKVHADATNLAVLIDHSDDLIWSVDRNVKMLFGNRAFRHCFHSFAGFYPTEGQYLLDTRVPLNMRHLWQKSYTKALKGEALLLNESWAQEANTMHMEINFHPVYNPDGDVMGVNCYVKDVTRHKVNDDLIRAQNESLRKIAWMQSHKMRRPVANLLGIVELMKMDFPERMKGDSLMEALYESVTQVDALTREIVLATKDLGLPD
ncbi:PAS domain-containing protein [Filimonas effusa]|uniref:PAS domain S-box protein n=1 Tax=Filimonas effusa TaxID=2508721 RepID=A0A4Q1DCX4_9BACT|nr:PAS domain-containing protein [Filimonas effusa]RXK87327.1 PAS domain S-box protein [Filimonas effusa]